MKPREQSAISPQRRSAGVRMGTGGPPHPSLDSSFRPSAALKVSGHLPRPTPGFVPAEAAQLLTLSSGALPDQVP